LIDGFLSFRVFSLASAANTRRREAYAFGLSVRPAVRCPSVNTYSAISLLDGGISMKLGISDRRVSGHCWKCFQGQRVKVKVVARSRIYFFCMKRYLRT